MGRPGGHITNLQQQFSTWVNGTVDCGKFHSCWHLGLMPHPARAPADPPRPRDQVLSMRDTEAIRGTRTAMARTDPSHIHSLTLTFFQISSFEPKSGALKNGVWGMRGRSDVLKSDAAFFFFFLRFYLFLERGERKETSVCGCLSHTP